MNKSQLLLTKYFLQVIATDAVEIGVQSDPGNNGVKISLDRGSKGEMRDRAGGEGGEGEPGEGGVSEPESGEGHGRSGGSPMLNIFNLISGGGYQLILNKNLNFME